MWRCNPKSDELTAQKLSIGQLQKIKNLQGTLQHCIVSAAIHIKHNNHGKNPTSGGSLLDWVKRLYRCFAGVVWRSDLVFGHNFLEGHGRQKIYIFEMERVESGAVAVGVTVS